MTDESLKNRPIRSFVIRPGRLTKGQKTALEQDWNEYGLEMPTKPVDFTAIFRRETNLKHEAKRVLEIGYGMGKSLVEMAAKDPDSDFIGIEVHTPGVGALIALAKEQALTNLKTYNGDAIEVIKQIPDASVDRVQLFFPDPWHKKRHNKRRIVNDGFAQSIRRILKQDGHLHMATDWEPYMQHMLEVMDTAEGFINIAGKAGTIARPEYRPLTKFEQRGERKGHGVWDLIYAKQ